MDINADVAGEVRDIIFIVHKASFKLYTMWTYIVCLIVLIYYYVYKKIQQYFGYWSERGIIGPKPLFLIGNIKQVVWPKNYSLITLGAKIYEDYKNEKVVGVYQGLTPTLVVRDPEIIKTILIKDFSKFNDRGIVISQKVLNIFISKYDEWHPVRNNLSPEFTPKKLKEMMPLLNSNVKKYTDFVKKLVASGPAPTKMRELNLKYNINGISSAAFGVNFDTYNKKKTKIENTINYYVSNDFRYLGYYILKKLIPEIILNEAYPYKFPNEYFEYFQRLVRQLLHQRKDNIVTREDLFAKLISQEKNKNNGTLETNNRKILFETMFFFVAGSETTANSMTYVLYELAMNPTMQTRCQIEIDTAMKKHNNTLDYGTLTNELKYLNMVLEETLRKYPVGGLVFREALTDYTFKEINLSIKKGTIIWIPVLGFHKDEKYFTDPEKFDPERFLPENRETIKDFYYPFGAGPRNCIGLRFANLQFLLGVSHFLHNFRVSACEKTAKSVKFDPCYLTLAPKDDIWLAIEKRDDK